MFSKNNVTNYSQSDNRKFLIEIIILKYKRGIVLLIQDNVLFVNGLLGSIIGEIVVLPRIKNQNIYGQVLSLNNFGITSVILYGDDSEVNIGENIYSSHQLLQIAVGYNFLGCIINAFGQLIKQIPEILFSFKFGTSNKLLTPELKFCILIKKYQFLHCFYTIFNQNRSDFINKLPLIEIQVLVEAKVPGILERKSVNRALYTGWKAIDGLIPIGRGQRELIIGDRQTGKTTIAVDSILRQNQGAWLNSNYEISIGYRNYNVFSIYVAIGQKRSSIIRLYELFNKINSLYSTIIVSATSSESAALQFLAPYTGSCHGEFFRNLGNDSIIIFDDLSKHAVAYRQISLLLRRSPGREAYPGDVFFLHSRLLERGAQLSKLILGGSLTILPIVETQGGDVTAYIPTNVISITDGQIFLETELFYKGIRPAISIGLSVSRVGSTAQIPLIKYVSGSLKLQLAQFRELEAFASFGGELDKTSKHLINRGLRLIELLKQPVHSPYDVHEIIIILYAGLIGFFDDLELSQINLFEIYLINALNEEEEYVLCLIQIDFKVYKSLILYIIYDLISENKNLYLNPVVYDSFLFSYEKRDASFSFEEEASSSYDEETEDVDDEENKNFEKWLF